VRKPRYALTRAIRRVSLTELNEAEERIGSLEIAHETDLKFLETLESFAVQMAEEDDLLLDDGFEEDAEQEPDEARMAAGVDVQEAGALEPDLEPDAPEADLDLEDVLEDPEPAAAPPPPPLPPAPPAMATPAVLDDEPPTIVDAGRPRPKPAPPADPAQPIGMVDDDAVVAPPPLEEASEEYYDVDEDDPDSLDPDTNELLAAVEQTFSELESMEEPEGDLGELEGGPDLESEGLGEIDAGPMQSWDGTSLDEYMTASPGEMGMASWDGDSLEEYIAWNPDMADDLASWDGTSYEEYLGQKAPAEPPAEEKRSSASDVDAWLTEQKLPAATGDPAVDPLGLGDDQPAPEGDDEDTAATGADEDTAAAPLKDAELDLVASQVADGVPDEPAFSLDLEESGELELDLETAGAPPAPTPDTPPTPASAAVSKDEDTEDDVLDGAVEVNSRDELIVQVGAGLDAALSAEPISLVLDMDEGAGSEPSVGPVDDLSSGLAIPRSASLAALTGSGAGVAEDGGEQQGQKTGQATAETPPRRTNGES